MSFICGGVQEETLTKDPLQPGLNKSVDINSKDSVMLLLFPLKCVKVQSMYRCSIYSQSVHAVYVGVSQVCVLRVVNNKAALNGLCISSSRSINTFNVSYVMIGSVKSDALYAFLYSPLFILFSTFLCQ